MCWPTKNYSSHVSKNVMLNISAFEHEAELVQYLQRLPATLNCKMGMVFRTDREGREINVTFRFDDSPGGYQPSGSIQAYRHRWYTRQTFPMWEGQGPRDSFLGGHPDGHSKDPDYFSSGFLAFQHLLTTLVHSRNRTQPMANTMRTLQLRRFPYPK